MLRCQLCDGEGGWIGSANLGYDPEYGGCRRSPLHYVKCEDCNGTGKWSEERKAAWDVGQAWEQERRKRGELIIETADRLGIKPSEVCDIRDGRLPVPKTP